MPDKEEGIEGIRKDIHFDDKRAVLDIDLVAQEIARKIISYRQVAVRYAKQAIVGGLDLPLPDGLELERRLSNLLLSAKIV